MIARRDLLIGAAVAAAVCVELALSHERQGAYALNVLVFGSAGLSLALRRRAPLLSLVLSLGLVMVGTAFLTDITDLTMSLLFLVMPMYAVGHECDGGRAYAGIPIAIALLFGITLTQHVITLDHVGFPIGIQLASFTCGRLLRNRMLLSRALADEAARLELDRELRAHAAVGEERARIAREMHDVVAHTMAIMVVQAGAARRTLDRDRVAAVQALATVEDTGRAAMVELRRLLGFLREEAPASLVPQPSLADLDRLVARARSAGLPVELGSEGVPFDLGAGGELAVYRVVQEALTNALKHAGPGARATVTLTWSEGSLEVLVVDSGGRGSGTVGTGHGLLGMRERVAMVGGTVSARPRPDGGFAVRASIPRAKVAA